MTVEQPLIAVENVSKSSISPLTTESRGFEDRSVGILDGLRAYATTVWLR